MCWLPGTLVISPFSNPTELAERAREGERDGQEGERERDGESKSERQTDGQKETGEGPNADWKCQLPDFVWRDRKHTEANGLIRGEATSPGPAESSVKKKGDGFLLKPGRQGRR